MSWFEKLMPSRIRTDTASKRGVPEGLWAKCPGCSAILYRAELERNLEVCPKCGYHNRIGARRRLDGFLDPEPREEIAAQLVISTGTVISVLVISRFVHLPCRTMPVNPASSSFRTATSASAC